MLRFSLLALKQRAGGSPPEPTTSKPDLGPQAAQRSSGNRRPAIRKPFLVAAVTTVLLAATGSPAGAITYGVPDGNTHPEVGALIADHAYSDGTWAYCSGTLISPTVFVTAAHCGDPGQTTARVSFSSHYHDGDTVYIGQYIADPRYRGAQSDPYDLAVVVFAKAIPKLTPARLPSAGLLDRIDLKSATFTSVGYGSYEPTMGPGGPGFRYDDLRQQASGSFFALNDAWLRLSQNPTIGDGGTCYGDSGGPNFLGDSSSNLLVATTITGDTVCRSTNVDYRLDTVAAREFLGQFVTLP
jgi:V8-like Glu-specific endopeptidase